MFLWEWLLNDLSGILQFPRLAVGIFSLGLLVGWWAKRTLSSTQVANLQSEVALLKSQLEAANASPGPLPSYSLGGSDTLVYNNENWTTQDTAKKVGLDWSVLKNIEAYAAVRLRTEGESPSQWIQARIINVTDNEIVATSERHSGSTISQRFPLQRATGIKTYAMEVRGKGAGLEGSIELVRN